MTDRGVSELVSFVLIFSLVTTTVGVVYAVGYPQLEQARDAEQLENVERAFDVLADNIGEVHREDAPNRATEFKLHQAELALGEPAKFQVTIENVASPNPTYSVSTYPITYAAHDSAATVRYVNGAVFREDAGRAQMLKEPSFVFRKHGDVRTAGIAILETRSPEPQRVTGSRTVRIETDLAISETLTERTTPSVANSDPDGDGAAEYLVTVTVQTGETRAPLWAAYLEEELEATYPSVDDPCTVTAGRVDCTFPVERLYVTATRMSVTIGP